MIQDQTYMRFNRCTRNKFNLTWRPLPFTMKKEGLYEPKKNKQMFSDVRHHSIILKNKPKIKPCLTHDRSMLLHTCVSLLFTYCLQTELLLFLVTVVSQEFLWGLSTFSQPDSITPSVHLQYIYWTLQSHINLSTDFTCMVVVTQGKYHTQHKVQYLPSEQHFHYFNLSCVKCWTPWKQRGHKTLFLKQACFLIMFTYFLNKRLIPWWRHVLNMVKTQTHWTAALCTWKATVGFPPDLRISLVSRCSFNMYWSGY